VRYIGLDLGTKTLGIATSDRTGIIASPYKTIIYKNQDKLIEELLNILKAEEITNIVIGMPLNMNGTVGPSGERTYEFIDKLQEKTKLPINTQDERLSTMEVERVLIDADMSRKKRKKVIDKMAAVVILQNYLNKIK
jgi:putative Holliday junction resolvase